MQPLCYDVAASVDGFIAAQNGSFDDFPHDEDFAATFLASLDRFHAVVMGRAACQVGADDRTTTPFPWLDIDKVDVSTTLTAPSDPAVRISDDPVAEVRRMKETASGPIWLCGDSVLARTLLEADLIDIAEVKHNPLLLGAGIPFFAEARRTIRLRPTDASLHEPSGIRTVSYAVV